MLTYWFLHCSCYGTGCDNGVYSSRQTDEIVSRQLHGAYSTGSDTVGATVLAVTVTSTVVDRLMRQCPAVWCVHKLQYWSDTVVATALAVTAMSIVVDRQLSQCHSSGMVLIVLVLTL